MAVRFTRSSSQYWARTSGAVLNFNADYTLMAWIYLTSDVNNYSGIFAVFGSTTSAVDALQTAVDGTTLNLYCEGGTGTLDSNGSALDLNTWYHAALTRSGQIVRVYLNGAISIAGTQNNGSRAAAARMYAGSWFGTSDYGDLRIAQMRAFQAALTPEQIAAEMLSDWPVLEQPLFGWWPAWERGAGARNRDWGGNGYDFTEVATPTDENDPPLNASFWLLPIALDVIASPVNVTGDDSAAVSEEIDLSAALQATEETALTEGISLAVTLAGTDDAMLAESSELSTATQIAASDSASMSETISLAAALNVTESATEDEASAAAAILAGAETATLAEAAALDTTTPIGGEDSANLAESTTIAAILPATDSAILSESGSAGSFSSNRKITVGDGYMDVTPRAVVRTSDQRLFISSWKFDTYPHGGIGGSPYNAQTLRMYRADQVGTPSTFSRMDTAHEPAGVTSWAMAIDSQDVIHLAWLTRASWGSDGIDNFVRYCTFDTATGTWSAVEDIETAAGTHEMGQGDELVAIAIDAANIPHILYLKHDGTRRRVIYRNRSGGSWSSPTTVDDQTFGANEQCWHPGIVFDTDGRIVVTWMRGAADATTTGRYFMRVYNGSWGTTHDVVGANLWTGIDTGTPVYVDANGRYHICYINTSKQVQYRYSDDQGATWTANHPGNGTYTADNPTPGPGPNGKVRIYSHSDDVSPNIVYWEGDGGSETWSSATDYVTFTPLDCSVNVRWSRYHWHYPNTLDIVYWENAYPTNHLFLGTDVVATDRYAVDDAAMNEAATSAAILLATENATLSEFSALNTGSNPAGSEEFIATEIGLVTVVISASEAYTLTETADRQIGETLNAVDSCSLSEISNMLVEASATNVYILSGEFSTLLVELNGSEVIIPIENSVLNGSGVVRDTVQFTMYLGRDRMIDASIDRVQPFEMEF